jgi:hypothetical protein
LFHVIGQEVPRWRFSMIHIYLQWQELAWDSKSSSMRFGYSYFTGHEVFNLWFIKHMHHKCIRINSNHSRFLWCGQWELKASKYHNFWRFIKLIITASLREGPFFYFYVESLPSIFMHCLREHSCHSEYNVHCPKVFIDWFMMLVSLVLKLFVSSRPLKLEGVLCIYVLLSHEGQAKHHLYVFPNDLKTHLTFIVSFSWSFVCVIFHVITWLLSFFYQDYVFHAHVLSSFDPSAQRLHWWSRLCRCISPQFFFFCYHLPTRGRAGVKLGDADTSQTYP